jgi:Tol biopolymer transport system component
MRCNQLGLTAAVAAVVVAATACEPAPTPWDVEPVSVNAAGTGPGDGVSDSAVWSADGSVVAFTSTSHDLTPAGDWNDAAMDVYVRDLETGVTTPASPHPPVDFSCCTTVDALSADGTRVLFHSTLGNLTSLPDTNGGYDYFVRDLVAGTTTVVSVDASGEGTGNGPSAPQGYYQAFMTPDGSKVAFMSGASNLVFPPVFDIGAGVYVRDLASNTTTHVGPAESLEGFSADGTRVLFTSREPLVPEDGNGINGFDLYLHDLAAGTTTLVSANADGTAAGAPTFDGSLTPDGERVVFTSASPDVVPATVDTNGTADVFLRDLATGTTRMVSTDASGTASTGGADGLLSPDESKVVFEAGGGEDLHVKDLATGGVTLVTPRTGGDAGGHGQLDPVGFTSDSRVVAFTSDAANLGPVDENVKTDVYAHDLPSGTTHLVSVASDGSTARGVSSQVGYPVAAVSPAGRQVLFLSGNVYAATLQLADVALTGSVEASGGALTYELSVSTAGPDGVEDVDLALVLPEGASFSAATTTTGTCELVQPRVIKCSLGDAEAGVVADVAVSATVQAPSGSLLETTAAVTSATYDAHGDDNVVTLTSHAG